MRLIKWIAIVGMALSLPLGAWAIDLGSSGLTTAGGNAGVNTSGAEGSLTGMIGLLVGTAMNLLGVLIFVFFVYAGFLWMTAQGDEKQVKKAKDLMQNSVIGLIIVLLAYSLSFYVLTYLSEGQVSDVGLADLVTTAGNAGLNTSMTDPIQIIGYYIGIGLNLLGVVLLGIFLYAGWLWMTAAGDSKQVDKAKAMMRTALIGLIITLSARILASFVVDQLAGEDSALTSYEHHLYIHNING